MTAQQFEIASRLRAYGEADLGYASAFTAALIQQIFYDRDDVTEKEVISRLKLESNCIAHTIEVLEGRHPFLQRDEE